LGKRLAVFGAAIALTALAVGVVAPAMGSSRDDKQVTFKVTGTTTEENFLDLGEEGPSLGDEFIFSSDLEGEEQSGHLAVVCTFVSLDREEVQCVATASLEGGQITVQGLIAGEPERFVLPVTGGSGRFEGVDGEVHVRQVSDTEEKITFHLEL
jgi:hypothetical protein